MDTTDTTMIGAFDGHTEARRAVEELRRAGFADDRLHVIEPTHSAEGSGLGLSADDARWGEAELSRGRYLVVVRTGERGGEARDVIRRSGGEVREAADLGIYGTGLLATPY